MGIKRQREQRLRETLREIRSAIDEFHRDTVGVQCIGSATSSRLPSFATPPDPRSRVIIADCTIFGVDNPDRYPPDLETLVNGVNVVARTTLVTGGGPSGPNATEVNNLATKKKVYLRSMPIDPLTGKIRLAAPLLLRCVRRDLLGPGERFRYTLRRKRNCIER